MARSDTIAISLEGAAFWTFALSVALLPIGLGGDRPVPLGLCQAGLAVSCICLAADGEAWARVRLFARLRVALLMLAAVLVWALLQTQPFMPEAWHHPLWSETAKVLSVPVQGAIAVSPEDSLKGLARLVTYIAAGALSYALTQSAERAYGFVRLVWRVGAAMCGYGLLLAMTGSRTILWYAKWAYEDDLTATFVNHNHFAIYAGMVMTCGAALLARSYLNEAAAKKGRFRADALRAWLMRKGIPRAGLVAMVFACVILSHSRAGLAMSLAGLGGYAFFYSLYLRAWRRAAAVAIVSISGLVAFLLIAMRASPHFGALFSDYSSLDRLEAYKIAVRAILDNPWLGYGLNGYEPEFRLYQRGMQMEFNHAHSDMLESLVDLGVPAGLLLWGAIGLLLTGLVRGLFKRRRNGIFPALALACSLMVLGHACVDFSLQIPGVAMTWAALLGTGLAQSRSRAERQA